MVQNYEMNETSIIQNNNFSSITSLPSPLYITKKSFSSRLTHLIRRDPTKKFSNPSQKPTKIYKTEMILLNPTDPKYVLIKSSFKGRILSLTKILGIFELRMPTKLEERHESYKRSL